MAHRLQDSPKIHHLAHELGMPPSRTVVADILNFCENRVKELLVDFLDCTNLSEVLDCVAAKAGTVFEVVHSDEELLQIRQKYLELGEVRFAAIIEDLSGKDDFGITIRRKKREPWELLYVSVIDCRGDKAAREYFTKWHEVAHLLTLTDQMRVSFRRSHSSANKKDPEEILMDVIAGRLGFHPPGEFSHTTDEISFEVIDQLRHRLCPEASKQSALIGFVKFWPTPCLLICAKMNLRKREEEQLCQHSFSFVEGPKPVLRAVYVTASDAARESGFNIFENMRIPEASVIHRVFNESTEYDEAEEDLCWWKTSSGMILPECRILIKARRGWDMVEALITPVAI